jgi:hypothetical protein
VSTVSTELLSEPEAGQPGSAETPAEIAARSPLQLFWRRLKQDWLALIALGVVVVIILTAIFAPVIVDLAGTAEPRAQNSDLTGDFGEPLGPNADASSPSADGHDGPGRPVRLGQAGRGRLLRDGLRQPHLADGRVHRHGDHRPGRGDARPARRATTAAGSTRC